MAEIFTPSSPNKNNSSLNSAQILAFVKTLSRRLSFYGIDTIRKILKIKKLLENSDDISTTNLYRQIKTMIDDKIITDIFRLERWPSGVLCIHCESDQVIKVDIVNHKIKFYCEKCEQFFTDDEESPIQNDDLNTWMMLWLLSNKGNSADVIAQELNLDLEQVKAMLNILRKKFKKRKPLTSIFSVDNMNQLTFSELSTIIESGDFHSALASAALTRKGTNQRKT